MNLDGVLRCCSAAIAGLPHTRGGGSRGGKIPSCPTGFSPHAWGWTEKMDSRFRPSLRGDLRRE
jgi:hypothetical protein